METDLSKILSQVLRPLVRLMISSGIGIAATTELLKKLYVEQAGQNFQIEGKRVTDSRISVLTGLRRREVKRLRTAPEIANSPTIGAVPRVLVRWTAGPGWQDEEGAPLDLPLRGDGLRTFERLVAEVSQDIHSRTVLDALLAEGSIDVDETGDTVRLSTEFFLPKSRQMRLQYLGANLGDHANAAVQNLLVQPEVPRFFERAAHFNKLSAESLAELEEFARKAQGDVLKRIAERALNAQQHDIGKPQATQRFRCGVFIYSEDTVVKDSEKGDHI